MRRHPEASASQNGAPRLSIAAMSRNIGKDGSFVCYGPAGGGYGDPLKRDPVKVADDVLDGMISVETARRDYGVVVSATGVVDTEATAALRASASS